MNPINCKLQISIGTFDYIACCIVVLFVTNTRPVPVLNHKNWYTKIGASEWNSIMSLQVPECADTLTYRPGNKSRAFYTSAGEFGSVSGVLSTVNQLRRKCSNEVIVVVHCQEINARTVKFLRTIKGVILKNVCPRLSADQLVRFRSYYCKLLAVIYSKHRHFVMIDIDALWFQSPSDLTDELISKNASAFFFHDHTHYLGHLGPTPPNRDLDRPEYMNKPQLVTFLRQYMTDGQIARSPFLSQSNIMNRVSNVDVDASYVYFNAVYAKAALRLISDWKYSYHFGFADQEMYWLVSVIANLDIQQDPWRPASYPHKDIHCTYCSCQNHQLHYHPFRSTPGLFHSNAGPLHEVQIEPTEKTKFVHIKCPKVPVCYSPAVSLDYTKANIVKSCVILGECFSHERYNSMSVELLRSFLRLRLVNIKTSSIEYAINGID